ncbi:hypothetical protein F1642_10275 [Paracoccus sp. NBH48]|nr:hypothetical protein [Paracoccus sp. NBH48]
MICRVQASSSPSWARVRASPSGHAPRSAPRHRPRPPRPPRPPRRRRPDRGRVPPPSPRLRLGPRGRPRPPCPPVEAEMASRDASSSASSRK